MAVTFHKRMKIGNYVAKMKIQSVPKSANRPDGFKVNFVLLRLDDFEQVLLIDNHAPLGYHMHCNPDKPKERIPLDVSSPFEALEFFESKVEEIVDDQGK